MNNPFTLSFGKKPLQYISRLSQTTEIVENFKAAEPSNQIYMITGIRGSGKTVMMTNIAGEIKKEENWVSVLGKQRQGDNRGYPAGVRSVP